MQTSVAKKIFALGTAAATVLGAIAPLSALAATHAEGTNIKSSDGTVWMIIGGQRRPYTSAGAFLSYGFNSWGTVVDANAEDVALPVGSFIPPQDGKIICSDRGADKGTCYLITQSMKAGFTSASVFTGLGFSFSRAQNGDVSWMASTSNIDNTTDAHRVGVLINNGGTVQLRGISGNLGIPDLATFNSWGYSFADVVPSDAADRAMTQTGVMVARVAGQLSPGTDGSSTTPPPTTSGSVSASLAYDNPAGGTIVASSSAVTLAKFTFTGNGTITAVNFKRIGVSSDTVLSNVYLYDGATRLTDAASVGGGSMINFSNASGLFTVSGSKTISVVAEIGGSATSGQTIGVQLTGYTVSGSSPAATMFSGNLFTVSSVSDLATISFGSVTPTGSAFDPASDVEIFRSNVSVGTRDVTLSRLSIRQIGSVNNTDIRNFRLLIDGTQVAQVAGLTNDGYANFSFPLTNLKSGTRIVRILADIVGGSSRNFQFQIRNKVDVDFTDTNYGVVISPSTAFPVGSVSSNSINSGQLTFQKATNSPSGDVIDNSADVVLARYTVTAYGEPLKIETLVAAATSSDNAVGSLRNGRIFINGAQYGSTATLSKCTNSACTTGGTSFTVNYTVQPGTPVTLELRADAFDNDGTNSLNSADTLTGYIVAGSSNVQRMVSLGYIGAPASSVAGNTLNDVTGSMTLNKNNNYASQTTPLPQTNYKFASFNLVGNSSEDVTVNSIDLGINASTTALDYSELTDVMVKVNGNVFGTVKSTLSSGTTTFSGSVNLAKNQTVPVEFFATVNNSGTASSANQDNIKAQVVVSGTTVNSSASVTAGTAGQTISYGSGTLTISKDGSSPDAAIVADEQTRTAVAYKFQAASDSFSITELTFTLAGNTTVNNVVLKDGSSVIGTRPGASSVTFSGLNIPVSANSTKVLTVDLQLGTVGVGAGTTNEDVTVTLSSTKYSNSSGVQTTASPASVGNAMYVFRAIPTITPTALPSSSLTTGTQTLSKFTVSSGGTGSISWNKIIFTINKSANPSLSAFSLVNADTNIALTGTFATSTQFATSTAVASGTLTFTVTGNNGEEDITSRTYALKATVGGTLTSGDFVATNIAQGQSSHQSSATSTGVAGSPTFVWSDQSASSHSTTTADWSGDFLVKNIPTDIQSLEKN